MVQSCLEGDRIPEFVPHLMTRKPVYPPHRKGQQSFALERAVRAEDVVLDYPRTLHSIKKFFLPPREDLLHFAGSVGIRPEDNTGCDIFLTRLFDGYVLEVLSLTGQELMAGLDLPAHEAGKPATVHFKQHIFLPQAKLGEVMERSYDAEESVDITATKGSRELHWDGCMLSKFSEVAGGEVFRESLASRLLHRRHQHRQHGEQAHRGLRTRRRGATVTVTLPRQSRLRRG